MRQILVVLIVSAISFASCFARSGQAQSQQELVKLGQYILTAVQGCGCHTREKPDTSKDMDWFLAGAPSKPPPKGPPANVGWTNPRWKKLYGKNITPDPETGIGTWAESDFTRAMRTGVTPDGRVLDPFMPWHAFQEITDRDLKAMWVYLRTIKPIKNKAPESIPAGK
ncbi:MAG: hypothetical protein HYY46_09340 [Deltaproteobacteria bacterium]|nr:hypothetical protein [Deltaproteobacteria bacterium]